MNTTSACQRQPMTPAQTGIWLEQSIHPQSTQFVISTYYVIPLPLDVDRLIAAVNWVFSRYEALYARLTPGPEGTPDVLFDPAHAPQCGYLDLSGEPDPQDALQEWIVRQSRVPFPMLDSPLSRPVLIKTGDCSFCYFCTYHHSLIDGWGTGIVFPRIARVYEELGKGLEPRMEGGSFADYLDHGDKPQSHRALERAREFWGPLLTSPLPVVPPCHAWGEHEDELATSCIVFTLPRELADRVSRQASASNATLFHALLLAYSYLISRQYSLESSALSLPILNRGKEHKETIGLFVEARTVPLPLDETTSVGENLDAIARRMQGVYRHYRLPAAELARLYQSQGNSGLPASHSTLSYITRDFGASIDGVLVPMANVPPAHDRAAFTLFILDTCPGRDIELQWVYQNRHLNRDEAQLFAQKLLHLLQSLAENPSCRLCDLELLPTQERSRIAAALRPKVEHAAPARPIIDDVLARARTCPDVIAVETGDSRRSYRECVEKANAMAGSLVQRYGVRPGDRVALLLERGADLVSGYLATMMAGATAVPLEPHGPELRQRQVCADSDAKCIIANTALAARARAIHGERLLADAIQGSAAAFSPLTDLDQIAYIIYTSGSTGVPKGVEISHRALAEHLASWSRSVPLREACERVLFFHSPAFDASIEAVFPSLLLGNTLVAAPHPQWSAHELAKVIVQRHLSVLYLPPAYLLEFLRVAREDPGRLAGNSVRMCITGGDIMHAETAPLWQSVFGASAALFNTYGPTEATVTTTVFQLPVGFRAEPGESIPIGKPYEGRALRIVNARDRDVPVGAEGELLIGGIGLARGYRAMPEKTAERFATLEDGVRYYSSGDIVKLKSDGNLVFRRRLDRQLKIRGFRVEPGEIEACLLTCRDVRECAVVARWRADDNEMELTAFVVLLAGSGADGHSLRQYLFARLPNYMVPSISVLEWLPKTASEKIDRHALLSLPTTGKRPQSDAPAVCLPKGVVQEYLAVLWSQALGTTVTDVHADFFELGGHSLLAAKLVSSIGKAFRLEYPFSLFFDEPTITDTERKLEQLVGDKARLETMASVRIELARLSPEQVRARLEAVRQKSL